MRNVLFLLLSLTALLRAELPAPIALDEVAIVFNAQSEGSQALAIAYAKARDIPTTQLIPLDLPDKKTVTRDEYNALIRDPLIKTFDREIWWNRRAQADGVKLPVRNKIRVLLLMKGVPYRISRQSIGIGDDGKPLKPAQGKENEASVDSELVYLGVENHPTEGPLNNPYFNRNEGLNNPNLTPLLFTCRLDGASYETCERIIRDSIEVEKAGLWGLCYLDEAIKGTNYESGDNWLREIARTNRKAGIPTVVERTRDTYTTNYPMNDAALYYGWYATHRNGPLLNPKFRFKKGAVAIHLHSFSAVQLEKKNRNWSAAILEHGAAATVGNVWEPYLAGTHNLNVLHDRLLKGYSLVEAAHMAMPTHSWQSIVIGDPLYRPFKAWADQPEVAPADRVFQAYKVAVQQWTSEPEKLVTKLRTAAARMSSGTLYESLGLRKLEENSIEEARAFFDSASRSYPGAPDKLRQQLHLIDIARRYGEKDSALSLIAQANERFGGLPEAKSLVALKNIIAPPPPPPAQPRAVEN